MIELNAESDVLNEEVRKAILKQIGSQENQARKAEAFRRYECLKDRTSNYVLQLLLDQFDANTVIEMQYAVTNISLARKIVDKLARVYSNGVKRSLKKKTDTQAMETLAKRVNANSSMKKLNRYLKGLRNVLMYVKPVQPLSDSSGKYELQLAVYPNFLYDVIPDPKDPSRILAVILSSYEPMRREKYAIDAARAGRTREAQSSVLEMPNTASKMKADEDSVPKGEYIWWTNNFHFTTDKKGNFIKAQIAQGSTQPDLSNPIGQLPFVNFSADQENGFWSEGGNDLFDSAVRINALLTNINHVAITQGYGQLMMTGKNLPKSVKTGPNHCIQIEHDKEDPAPSVQFLTANPPLGELKELIEMYVALLLTTNNLSTAGVATALKGGGEFPSGIAMMIDKAESMEDVEDQAQIFRDHEPKIWTILFKWMELYKARGLLNDDFAQIKLPNMDSLKDLTLTFPKAQTILSEQEQLDIIERRRDLGLNTWVELVMRDDPSLDEKAALDKILTITEEKAQRLQDAVNQAAGLGQQPGQQPGQKPGDQAQPPLPGDEKQQPADNAAQDGAQE